MSSTNKSRSRSIASKTYAPNKPCGGDSCNCLRRSKQLWELDYQINQRGIHLDRVAINKAIWVVKKEVDRIERGDAESDER
jgi:hypothetical protein